MKGKRFWRPTPQNLITISFSSLLVKCKLPVVKKVTLWVTDPESMNRGPCYFYLHNRSPERNFIHEKLGF